MPGEGVLARFHRPGGVGVLNSFFARGWRIRPSKNARGGWSGLELTDTLVFKISKQW